ncbi:SelT/SelW/SelH family protein [Sphingobacterium sp. LRF_L2]|uniref:SelT/SelW/SelH family protein n=1 Tax=Sphingobacterium sp. LRF_L2 TaxID=3369421 RepID=UPI003F645B88
MLKRAIQIGFIYALFSLFLKKAMRMKPTVTIIYCPKCGWLLRAAYFAQELLVTFVDDVYGVTLVPSEISGRFSITIDNNILFDRKIEGRFPEIKEIKQLVRDQVNPNKDLGHSESKTKI